MLDTFRITKRLEPQWYITQPVDFTTRPIVCCWKPTATYSPSTFSLASIIKIQPFSNQKMTSVRLEPQLHITQPVVFTTRPHDR
jgi:hypothetical protein